MKVGMLIFEEFTDLDFFLSWDLLNRVRLVCGVADWSVLIAGTEVEHVSKAGISVKTTCSVEQLSECDAVVIGSGPKTRSLAQDKRYLERLHLDSSRQIIGSMCSGALILGALGLLKGKKATTYPTAVNMLRDFGVHVVNEPFVSEGKIATAAACLAGRDLSYWIIDHLKGRKFVKQVDESVRPLGG